MIYYGAYLSYISLKISLIFSYNIDCITPLSRSLIFNYPINYINLFTYMGLSIFLGISYI